MAITDPRRRVVFFVGRLSEGGAERVTSTLLNHLSRKRFKPELGLVRDQIEYPLPSDVPVRCLEREQGLWPWGKTIQTILWVKQWLAQRQPDLVVSMFSHYNLPIGSAVALAAAKTAWVARVANSPAADERGIRARWARWVYPKAGIIAANSVDLAEGFRHHHRWPQWPVIVLPNPIDTDTIDREASAAPAIALPPDPIIVAAGRLSQQKRYDIMLRAFVRISRESNAHLVILGDGAERESLQRMVGELGLHKQVSMYGFQKAIHPIMARASLFLLTSDYEGSPNALLEAQALGIPAVATDCRYGPNEIIVHGATGFLAPCANSDAIAEHSLTLLDNPALRAAMGSAARQRIRSLFSITAALPAWEAALELAVTRGNSLT